MENSFYFHPKITRVQIISNICKGLDYSYLSDSANVANLCRVCANDIYKELTRLAN